MADSQVAPRLAAVLSQVLQLGDLALAFEASGMAGRKRLDQPEDAIADLQSEVRCSGAGKGSDVLRGNGVRPGEQLGVLGLAHCPPIFASSASASISLCSFTEIASWSPITQTWL